MSLRDRVRSQTAGLRSTDQVAEAEIPAGDKPKTALGFNAALSETKLELSQANLSLKAANERIRELEAKGPAADLPVDRVSPNPWQPRLLFKPEPFAALVQSISEVGQEVPAVVRQDPSDGSRYQLVSGERRWRALKQLGKETIKAVVVVAGDEDMAVRALLENVVRDDLCDFEIARSVKATESAFPSRKRLAEALGQSRASLYRFFAYDKLPPFVLADLERQPSVLSANAAYALSTVLSRLPDTGERALRDLWPDLLAGRVQQTKLAELVESLATRREGQSGRAVKDSLRLFAGKEQVGSITKDSRNFALKIKATALTEAQEVQLRELVTNFFRGASE